MGHLLVTQWTVLSHTHTLLLWGWLVTTLAASQWVGVHCRCSQSWGCSINQMLIADSHLVKVSYIVIAQGRSDASCGRAAYFSILCVNERAIYAAAVHNMNIRAGRFTVCWNCNKRVCAEERWVSPTWATQWRLTVQTAGAAQIGHQGDLDQLRVWLTAQSGRRFKKNERAGRESCL